MRHQLRVQAEMDSMKNGPCADCGGRFPPCAIDFHHRDPGSKIGCVSELAHDGHLKLMREEIPKCDLLCKNCHAIRERASWEKRLDEKVRRARERQGTLWPEARG